MNLTRRQILALLGSTTTYFFFGGVYRPRRFPLLTELALASLQDTNPYPGEIIFPVVGNFTYSITTETFSTTVFDLRTGEVKPDPIFEEGHPIVVHYTYNKEDWLRFPPEEDPS